MAETIVAQLEQLTDRALLILLIERTTQMTTTVSAGIAELQDKVAQLSAAQEATKPVLQALVDINTRAIGVLESFAAQLAALQADPAAIAALSAQLDSEITEVKRESLQVSDQNTALQDELNKVAPPGPPPTTP
jgi:chromosome segregation ATPase